MSRLVIDPSRDGIDHINILAGKAKTILGKKLSHFAPSQFTHPYYGAFASMEGFWHYASTGFKHEQLRSMFGFAAKQFGRNLAKIWYDDFAEDILAANYQKIIQNQELSYLLCESELPFTHYYVFTKDGSDEQSIVTPRESKWLCEGFEVIRTCLQQGKVPDFWNSAVERYATNISHGRSPQDSGRT